MSIQNEKPDETGGVVEQVDDSFVRMAEGSLRQEASAMPKPPEGKDQGGEKDAEEMLALNDAHNSMCQALSRSSEVRSYLAGRSPEEDYSSSIKPDSRFGVYLRNTLVSSHSLVDMMDLLARIDGGWTPFNSVIKGELERVISQDENIKKYFEIKNGRWSERFQ